ncbi:MAG: DUF1489 family protein [Hyphomicrobiales bacterium]
MTMHLIKLSVGSESIETLTEWQALRFKNEKQVYHVTRMRPRREEEILDGGSIYWVIKGMIQVRQRVIALEPVTGEDDIKRVKLVFDPELVPVRPSPRRAFQGWRYLNVEDAPSDLPKNARSTDIPQEMRNDLAELGLI